MKTLDEGRLIRFNLGCGEMCIPGYINVDTVSSRRGKKPDLVADIRNLKKNKNRNCRRNNGNTCD